MHRYLGILLSVSWGLAVSAYALETREVDGQPLGANVSRLIEAFDYLGTPLPRELQESLHDAIRRRDATALQKLLDPQVLLVVSLNPEVRVKVTRGPGSAEIQQGGYTPVLVKVLNDSTVTRELRIGSPQAGAVYAGASLAILERQAQTELIDDENRANATDRFLDVQMFRAPPMTPQLSGLEVEYAIALIYSQESGKREATIQFDVGAGTQDIGFRGEVPILFDVRQAIPVKLAIVDHDGRPTTARITIRDSRGRVYPPQPKRLAPDFFFQPQIYRADGETILLPEGDFTFTFCRGPEYEVRRQSERIESGSENRVVLRLQRWIDATQFGFYAGDHHIHGAGCSHYQSPTQGVRPEDMFRQVKGEGLNVGCVLTWGPCFDFQRNYFSPTADRISEPFTILKYDLEISGFGSAALGHVCLLNLRDQTYPGSAGSKDRGWPTWTVPVMRWCKEQGGVTGYPHSAIHVNPQAAATRLLDRFDRDHDGLLDEAEGAAALLPERFEQVDRDRDGLLSSIELTRSSDQAADRLPNLAMPALNGAGAMEIFVSTPEGVCDFISAMDTARISEWNTWYHLMNCGFALKLSGETDFPCMSSRRVGQGRVYVQLGDVSELDFGDWCRGLAAGQSYVSDGFAHAVEFTVNGHVPGKEDVRLTDEEMVQVTAQVAFAKEIPRAVAYGERIPPSGRRMIGDTVQLHGPRSDAFSLGGQKTVEVVVNGRVAAKADVPADGELHELEFQVPVKRSSWVALRQFPQLHTNPVNVLVAGKPIRASRESARWCAESVRLLWKNRHTRIAPEERESAKEAYDRAIARYEKIAAESPLNRPGDH